MSEMLALFIRSSIHPFIRTGIEEYKAAVLLSSKVFFSALASNRLWAHQVHSTVNTIRMNVVFFLLSPLHPSYFLGVYVSCELEEKRINSLNGDYRVYDFVSDSMTRSSSLRSFCTFSLFFVKYSLYLISDLFTI